MNSILEALPEPVIVINNYDELVLANPSAERLFKFDSKRLDDRALADVLHSESLVNILAETRRRRVPSQRTAELELPDETGRHRWYSVMIRTLAPAEGEVGPGAMAVLRDISAQKESQKRNAEFVSAVSHEMKTPLAGIKAYVELLVDGDAEDEAAQEEFLNVINSQANRLQRLVDNLLNLARIEAGVVAVSKESRSLNELLEEAARRYDPTVDDTQIKGTQLDEAAFRAAVRRDWKLRMTAGFESIPPHVRCALYPVRHVLRIAVAAIGHVTLLHGQVATEAIETGLRHERHLTGHMERMRGLSMSFR